MKKKIGRPTSEPKIVVKKARISQADAAKLRLCSEKLGNTESEVIRMGINAIFNTAVNEEDAK